MNVSFLQLRDIKGQLRYTPLRVLKYLTNKAIRASRHRILERRARSTSRPVVDSGSGVTVTMTTHGDRINYVYITIESIAAGTLRPSRLILYLDAPGPKHLPDTLKRLISRGLEIEYVEGAHGPHTKYFGYVESHTSFEEALVTADDDVFYPKRWLQDLVTAFVPNKRHIICHRAHRIKFNSSKILPYNEWTSVDSTIPSVLHFATGVSGVLYPPEFLRVLKKLGSTFKDYAPKADDVWLHSVAIQHGYKIRQISAQPLDLLTVRGTQAQSLQSENVIGARNDEQIDLTYGPEHRSIVCEAERAERRIASDMPSQGYFG